MTFLKKLGATLLTIGKTILNIGPMLVPVLIPGSTGTEISALLAAIVQVETIGQTIGLTGAQKAAAAAPTIAQMFLNSTLLAGKTPKNPAAFAAAMQGIAGNVADALNAFDESDVKTN